jgi:hypothetical protein
VQVVEVDDVGLQAAQGDVAQRLIVSGRPSMPRWVPVASVMPHLDARVNRLRCGLRNLADQGFVVSQAIDRGGVEEGVAGVQRAQQHRSSACARGGGLAVGVAEAHAAEPDGRHLELTHTPRPHRLSLLTGCRARERRRGLADVKSG